jgi:hypothetical protein
LAGLQRVRMRRRNEGQIHCGSANLPRKSQRLPGRAAANTKKSGWVPANIAYGSTRVQPLADKVWQNLQV